VSSAQELYGVSSTNNFDLEQLRAELRKLTDVELRKFVREASEACDSGPDVDIRHVIRLQEGTAEWRRRQAKKMGSNTK
jgi:hypothetical protein